MLHDRSGSVKENAPSQRAASAYRENCVAWRLTLPLQSAVGCGRRQRPVRNRPDRREGDHVLSLWRTWAPSSYAGARCRHTAAGATCLPPATGARQGAPICRNGQMKAYAPLLCLIIWTAPCFAQTKQSAPLSIQPETKQSAPLSIQPGTTMLTLNKMCQENPNSRSYAVCMAYLRGLFDGMQQAKIVEDTKSTFCPPQTPDLDQIRLIIEQWVRDNPKNA